MGGEGEGDRLFDFGGAGGGREGERIVVGGFGVGGGVEEAAGVEGGEEGREAGRHN